MLKCTNAFHTFTEKDRLMNYISYKELCSVDAGKLVNTYFINVYSKCDKSKMLSDYRTDLKIKLFTQSSSFLGTKQVFCPPYYPQVKGHIQNIQNFLWNV